MGWYAHEKKASRPRTYDCIHKTCWLLTYSSPWFSFAYYWLLSSKSKYSGLQSSIVFWPCDEETGKHNLFRVCLFQSMMSRSSCGSLGIELSACKVEICLPEVFAARLTLPILSRGYVQPQSLTWASVLVFVSHIPTPCSHKHQLLTNEYRSVFPLFPSSFCSVFQFSLLLQAYRTPLTGLFFS